LIGVHQETRGKQARGERRGRHLKRRDMTREERLEVAVSRHQHIPMGKVVVQIYFTAYHIDYSLLSDNVVRLNTVNF
jgi:hypothetical protein